MSPLGVRSLGEPDRDFNVDPLDISREVIVECAQRAAMYANMIMDLAAARDDDGAAVMRCRLAVEVKGINMGFAALAEEMSRHSALAPAAAE